MAEVSWWIAATPRTRQDVLKLAGSVKTVINTHWHLESTGANDAMAKAGAKLVSHVNTELWMTQEIIHDWEKKVYPPRAKEALPTETFYTTGKTTFGGEPVEYGLMPMAHTDGDIYVYFPQSNVLVAGDAVQPGRLPLLDWPDGRLDRRHAGGAPHAASSGERHDQDRARPAGR